jgi:membrane protein insertase Oxa1/YidC/SpoIIIJ
LKQGTEVKKANAVAGILATFVVMPIWFYLLYKVLAAVNATELMWFLYWIYLPAALIVSIIRAVIGKE